MKKLLIFCLFLFSGNNKHFVKDCPYGITYQDQDSVRIWTAVNWCELEANTSKGIIEVKQYRFTQTPVMPKHIKKLQNGQH